MGVLMRGIESFIIY